MPCTLVAGQHAALAPSGPWLRNFRPLLNVPPSPELPIATIAVGQSSNQLAEAGGHWSRRAFARAADAAVAAA